MSEKQKRRRKRIVALIVSGTYVLIVLPIIGILISLFLDNLFNFPNLVLFPFNLIIAFILIGIGFFWAIWSNIEIYRKGEGSPVPTKETQTMNLVKTGPYKYCRTPMVFGYSLFWLGLGFLINSLFLTLGVAPLILILLIVVIKSWEEKNLVKRFGKAYIEYKKQVSFVIPLPSRKRRNETY